MDYSLFSKNFTLASVLALGAFSLGQSQEIATWSGFRTAAACFTFDDGAPSHVSDVGPLFDKYGYKATFNLVYNWSPDWSGFQSLASNGHEIASHSNSHGTNMSGEEASSKTNIAGKITQDYGLLTVAYPNCNVPNQSAVNQNYIAGRICNGSWQGVSDIMTKDGPSDWTKVPAIMTGSQGSITTTANFTEQMQKAVSQGGWVMFLTHGLTGKSNGSATYSPTDISAIEGALQWAQTNDSKIWVTTFRSATMYVKERKASKIEAVSGGTSGTLTYKLTHSIADNISKYDYPLSVRVKNDNNWSTVSATQDGAKIEASIKDGYIYFDAVPNGGNIVLSSENGNVTPASSAGVTSSSSVAPTSSADASGAFKGAIAIPGTVEAENYDVNAFSDSDGKNDETGYRTDDAGIVVVGSGYGLGYTNAGDWFDYTINVATAGKYKLTVRGSTGNASASSVTVSVGTESVAVSIPSTENDWNTYTEVEGGEMTLAAGTNTLRLSIDNSYVNIDWLKLESVNGESPLALKGEANFAANAPVRVSVFDMNGHLLKSTVVAAGSAQDVWESVNVSLAGGLYIMRYSMSGNSYRTVQVRK